MGIDKKVIGCLVMGGVVGLLSATVVSAKTLTVNAQDNIYGVGQTSAPGGGNVPTGFVRVPKGAMCMVVHSVKGSLACKARSGCIELNDTSGSNLNDPDGVGAAPATSSNTGSGSISGITAPLAGYLVGVFTPKGGPAGTAPASLDYTQTGTNFTSASPLVDQVFFVGDGKTGNNAGKTQQFTVPPGAKKLTFGISDACNYNGSPSCYTDNEGAYTVVVQIKTTPCN